MATLTMKKSLSPKAPTMSAFRNHKVTPKSIRTTLILKGYIKPKFGNRVDQLPGKAVAVRRVDDRPATRIISVTYVGG